MDDDTFLKSLRDATLPLVDFSHRSHLRLTWLLLRRHGYDGALAECCSLLRGYTCAAGLPEMFHHSLTAAGVDRVYAGMKPGQDFESFLADNPELMQDFLGQVHRHYSPELLDTRQAREAILPPDRAPFARAS